MAESDSAFFPSEPPTAWPDPDGPSEATAAGGAGSGRDQGRTLGQATSSGGSGRPDGGVVAIVALALVFALVVVFGAGRVLIDEATGPRRSPVIENDRPPPTAGTPTSPPPTNELEASLGGLIRFVEDQRGHEFKRRPTVETISEEAFDRRIGQQLTEDPEGLEEAQATLRALGLIPPDGDLLEIYTELTQGNAVGFYDPEAEELFVQGTEITPYRRTVLVHELTHALDDQFFDLERIDDIGNDVDEAGFGFQSVIEGTASWVESAYRAQLSPAEQNQVASEETRIALGTNPLEYPIAVQLQQALPYVAGESFVEAVVDDGGLALLDEAFEQPPVTSEQIFDPSAFLEGEQVFALDTPDSGRNVVDQGVFGAADLLVLLSGDDPTALMNPGDAEAAEPWAGGSYVTWSRSDASTCTRFVVIGDSPAETTALRSDLATWAEDSGAQVSTRFSVGVQSEVVQAISCSS